MWSNLWFLCLLSHFLKGIELLKTWDYQLPCSDLVGCYLGHLLPLEQEGVHGLDGLHKIAPCVATDILGVSSDSSLSPVMLPQAAFSGGAGGMRLV